MRHLLSAALLLSLTGLAGAADVPVNPQREAYFGELHVHTSYSLDSYIFGNRNDIETAYRFGRGEAATLFGGEMKKLSRPLDFMAVTDHGEFLGEEELCVTPGSAVYDSDICKGVRGLDMRQFGRIAASVTAQKRSPELCGNDGVRCTEAVATVWKREQEAANRYYQPGKFTTLIGYEYSTNIPGTHFGTDGTTTQAPGMLHRNVIFRSGTVPAAPFTAYDGPGEALDRWLETACKEPCRAIAIPHNSNYSWGRFFWDRNSDGSAFTREVLERRVRVEPLIEIFQIKGSSECQANLGLADEECGFENAVPVCEPGQTDGCASAGSFVREALVRGLDVERRWGVNPFKYGVIAATDTHNGTPGATEESTFKGHLAQQDNTPELRLGLKQGPAGFADPDGDGAGSYIKFNPGGLAGVWAERNTREGIWDALQRRETFGTSGTRIRVRFFGGFDLPSDLASGRTSGGDLVKTAYAKGVPMGGDLVGTAGQPKAPQFLVWAVRDPESAPLQKVQIIKGWVENGESKLSIIDVACSDGLKADASSGLCPDNAAKVDVGNCTPETGKGASELKALWTDPKFDAAQRAVYYVRVFENPVCRWSTHDSNKLGAAPRKAVPATVKERAWTSPIWYTPAR